MMRYRRWVILFSLLFLGQAAVVKEEVTFEEPSKLCSSPESELKSLKLSNLRQYERSGEQVRIPHRLHFDRVALLWIILVLYMYRV